jgi:hypothetical protein
MQTFIVTGKALEISQFLCMFFLSVRGFSDYAGRGHRVAFLLLGMKSAS